MAGLENLIELMQEQNLAEEIPEDEGLEDEDELNLGGWTYPALVEEIRQQTQDAVRAAGHTLLLVQRQFGAFGSVNLGVKGAQYNAIRRALVGIRERRVPLFPGAGNNILPVLTAFLTEPVAALPAYHGLAGPGGMGDAKVELNQCILRVRDRVSQVSGIAVGLQGN